MADNRGKHGYGRAGAVTHADLRRPISAAVTEPGYRADIDGLRAVAVLAVVLFHADTPGLTGGFVGVDVFFVISGFLITGQLWRQVNSTGTVALARFYGARARRLLPAGCAVLIATAVATALLLPALPARHVLTDGVASALYVGNYRFAIEGTDYLAGETAPSTFQHYWSLGVEEQFYLLWPALMMGIAWLAARRRRRGYGSSASPYLVVLSAVTAASFGLALAWTHELPSWAFFSLPTRAWELAAGGLIAVTTQFWAGLRAEWASVVAAAGLSLIVVSCIELGTTTPYPGTAALLPVLGAALVIGGGHQAFDVGASRLLSSPPARAVGRLSYSWYLWHWPVLVLAPVAVGHPLGLPARLAAAVMSLGLAALTLRFIENPVRRAASIRRSARRSLAIGGAVTAAAVAVGLTLSTILPAPVGHGAAAPVLTVSTSNPSGVPAADSFESAVQQLTANVQDAVAASAGLTAVPANLTPSIADAPADKPSVFTNGCVRSWLEVGQNECAGGDTTAPTTVALVGDSHAAMWSPSFKEIAVQRHWRLETLGKVTCPLQDLPITSPYLGREYTECVQWRGQVMARLQAERPRLIVLSMSRRYGGDFGFTSYDPAWLDTLTHLVADLKRTGAVVLVLGPVPDPHTNVPTCLSGHLEDASACAQPRSAAVNDGGIAAESAATIAGGGQYADVTQLFCTAERCPMIVGNNMVFRDDNHLTVEYAQSLAPVIGALADRALDRG
jgi:peptidoglycan/LPS O-acetylase OafA/YrhL